MKHRLKHRGAPEALSFFYGLIQTIFCPIGANKSFCSLTDDGGAASLLPERMCFIFERKAQNKNKGQYDYR